MRPGQRRDVICEVMRAAPQQAYVSRQNSCALREKDSASGDCFVGDQDLRMLTGLGMLSPS